MNDTIDHLLIVRSREPEGLRKMVAWSLAAHVASWFFFYMPG